MHKSSGKHMPDSSDEFQCSSSSSSSAAAAERARALRELVRQQPVVPLEKMPDDLTRAKQAELTQHLSKLCTHHFVTYVRRGGEPRFRFR